MRIRILIITILSILLIPVGYFLWIEYIMMCNNAVTEHLQEYSNLFDKNTTKETYAINAIGLTFGVHQRNLQECVDYTLEQRTRMEFSK